MWRGETSFLLPFWQLCEREKGAGEDSAGLGVCLCLWQTSEPPVKTWEITPEIASSEVKRADRGGKSKTDGGRSN